MNPMTMEPMTMEPMTMEPMTEFFADLVGVSGRTGVLILALVALRRIVRGRIPAQVWFAVRVAVALRLVVPFSLPMAWSPFNLTAARAVREAELP